MTSIKTAISLQKPLFDQIEALAHEMQVSRSHLFVLALEEFLLRHQNEQLLEKINQAYDTIPDPDEQALLAHMQATHRRLVEGEW